MEDEDDLAIKEYVLYQLETYDLVGIVNNLFCAYVNKIKFENIRQQREQVIENLRMSGNFIEAFMSTMDNFDVLLMPEEEYKKREQQYNSMMEYINLFEEDEEVQQALYRRITELDYDEDSVEYENSKIKFTIDCILPISEVKTYYEDTEIPYTKLGDIYVIEANDNGSYLITATSINKATSQITATVESKDVIPPSIDLENVIITNNSLIFSVYDANTEINYDSIYATLDDDSRIEPTYTDKSTGSIQFKINPGQRITVHIEDIEGNPVEATFVANE